MMPGKLKTPAAQIRAFVRPLLDRNPDLFLGARNIIYVSPVGHIARQIHLENRPSGGYFTLSWYLTEFYILGFKTYPPVFGQSFGRIGRSHKYRPPGKTGIWEWDDPTIAEDFIAQVEAEALPILRPLGDLRQTAEFIRGNSPLSYGYHAPIWEAMTHIALGDLDVAREHWAHASIKLMPKFQEGLSNPDPDIHEFCRRYLDIGDALKQGDRSTLAELLRENERDEATKNKIIRHWSPTSFPLEAVI